MGAFYFVDKLELLFCILLYKSCSLICASKSNFIFIKTLIHTITTGINLTGNINAKKIKNKTICIYIILPSGFPNCSSGDNFSYSFFLKKLK